MKHAWVGAMLVAALPMLYPLAARAESEVCPDGGWGGAPSLAVDELPEGSLLPIQWPADPCFNILPAVRVTVSSQGEVVYEGDVQPIGASRVAMVDVGELSGGTYTVQVGDSQQGLTILGSRPAQPNATSELVAMDVTVVQTRQALRLSVDGGIRASDSSATFWQINIVEPSELAGTIAAIRTRDGRGGAHHSPIETAPTTVCAEARFLSASGELGPAGDVLCTDTIDGLDLRFPTTSGGCTSLSFAPVAGWGWLILGVWACLRGARAPTRGRA